MFLVFTLIGLLIFHKPILYGAARFLAPASNEMAEILLLEGTEVVAKDALKVGMRLLSDGKANRMVVVLLQFSKENHALLLQEKYTQHIINELVHLDLEKEKVQVIWAPIDGHPITLTEARFVVFKLSQSGVRSAILLCEGFHTRRSFGIYSQEGARVGIHVVPYPYYIGYDIDHWWHRPLGIAHFFVEYFKLVYYILRGYVSIKYLYCP